jgi:hypothetical protein
MLYQLRFESGYLSSATDADGTWRRENSHFRRIQSSITNFIYLRTHDRISLEILCSTFYAIFHNKGLLFEETSGYCTYHLL